ncbi:MAG: hypothetical protein ACYC7M_10590, partial [Bellilinea sp.]
MRINNGMDVMADKNIAPKINTQIFSVMGNTDIKDGFVTMNNHSNETYKTETIKLVINKL